MLSSRSTPALLAALKKGSGLVIYAVMGGGPVGYPVPLKGFASALAGTAIDRKTYNERQRRLVNQLGSGETPMIRGTITIPKSLQVPAR